jgi:hypothetical protein
MSGYVDYAARSRSQKVLLATIEAKEKLKLFTIDENKFKRNVDYYVVGVNVDGSELEEAMSEDLGFSQYYFNPSSGELFVRLQSDKDPKETSLFVTYRLFFSNIPANAPHNLTSGHIVHYDSRIEKIGGLKLELDYENTGIALETDSSITLENNDGYFDGIFDRLIFENNKVRFYSWSLDLPFEEAKLIYRGFISDKSFSTQNIGFSLKDQLSVLRQPLDWPRFSELDGNLEESIIDKPKRIVFGRVDNLRLIGIDKELDGFELSGTISGSADTNLLSGTVSGTAGSSTITGLNTLFLTQVSNGDRIRVTGSLSEFTYTVSNVVSNTSLTISGTISQSFSGFSARNQNILNNKIIGIGTSFIDQVSPDDEITVIQDQTEYKFSVEDVLSNTEITLQDEIEVSFSGVKASNTPDIPYRRINRRWHVAGHKLREYSVLVTEVINFQSFKVNNPLDIENGDYVRIDGNTYIVRRVSTNIITLNQNLRTELQVGDSVTKIPVSECLVDNTRFIVDRDFSIDNSQDDCVLVFNDLAEFNAALPRSINITFSFSSGSRSIASVNSEVDLTTVIKPRDWIRARSINLPDWYEVLSVSQTSVILRSPAQATFSGQIQLKSPSYINDNSLVLADCLGLDNGSWIRHPSDAVKWILEEVGIDELNQDSFLEAKNDCRFDLSLYYPYSIGGEIPKIRDIISDINGSCFGSLYLDSDFQYTYKILNADRSLDMPIIKDEDVISFRVQTKSNIFNSVLLNYSPFVDPRSGEDAFKTILIESDFVNQAIQKKQQLDVTSYLFKEEDARVIAQRWLFFRSLTQSVITLTTKLQFSLLSLNSPVMIDLSRLFTRYGGASSRRIGLVNSITKDGLNTIIQINDLGNIFSRVTTISPNDAGDFDLEVDQLDSFGYIVDNLTETPDPASEVGLGVSLIG